MDIIKYSDLFDEQGLNSGLTNLIGQITKVRTELQGMIKEIKESATDLSKALSNTSSSTKNGRDDTNKQAEKVEKLYAAYKQLGLGIKYCEDNLKNLLIAHDKLAKATKLSETANKASADSVDRLKAQIGLAKLALEGMSEEQRKTSNEGKWLMDVISLLSEQVRGYKQAVKEAENADKESAKAKTEQANATQTQTQALENQTQILLKQANLADVFEELGISAKTFNNSILGTIDAQGKLTRALNLADVACNSNADSMAKAKAQAELAKIALDGLTSADRVSTQEGQILTNAVKELNAQIKLYESSLKKSATETISASNAMEEQSNETISLQSSYSSLNALINETGVNIEQLLLTEKQQSIATKNGVIANNSLSGSYNQLYAQYNLVKNVLNAMSDEMRKAEGVGKKWEAEALRMMNAMKSMQEATGKHTLSVGDYSKALNGLNIATTQVLREVPVLANSFQQFLVAISNNIPIFVDQLTAVKNATGSWAVAVKGAISVLFSWQTALLAVLTLLPMIVRKIDEKRRAQKDANKTTLEQITFLGLLRDAFLAVRKAEIESTAELITLVAITKDHNRTMEDRIGAARRLKEIYDDQLGQYSAEEIALGKAKTLIDDLTESLKKQAKARALLNKITEAYTKQIDAEQEAMDVGSSVVYEHNLKNIKNFYNYVQNQMKALNVTEDWLRKNIAFVAKGDKDVWERYDKYKEAQRVIVDTQKAIDDLTKKIDVDGLGGGDKGGKKAAKDIKSNLDDITDYYFDWLNSLARIIDNEYYKEKALNRVKFAEEIEDYRTHYNDLLKLRKDYGAEITRLQEEKAKIKANTSLSKESKDSAIAKIDEQIAKINASIAKMPEQERYILGIISNLQKEWLAKDNEIFEKLVERNRKTLEDAFKDLAKELEDEEISIKLQAEEEDSFVSIFDSLKNNIATISNDVLASRTKLNQAILDNDYKSAKEEGKVFQQLLEDKLRAEADYQKKLLEMRYVGGELTKAEYDKELADLDIKLNKNIANITKTRKKKKFDLWTMMFGETKEDGKGNVFKELSEEAQMFIGAFEESMSMAFDYMNEWMDKRMEMADVAIEAAQKESEAAKTALDYEMEARANGYANNVSLARQEYEEKLAIEQEAIREKERLAKVQEGIDSAMQLSSLITAAAELWASHASIPVAGPALAIAATALMFGSFAASKIQAFQASRAKAYGQGGSEYINYGGSHASGKDVDFGRTKDGRPRRIERGEIVGIINKKNVEKYGVRNIENIINSLNKGTFERDYEHDSTASILDMFRTDSSSISSFTSEDNVLTLLTAMESGKPISFEELALIMAIKALETKKAEKKKAEAENKSIIATTNSEERSLFKLDESNKISKMNMSDIILMDSLTREHLLSSRSEESNSDSVARMMQTLASSLSEEKSYNLVSDSSVLEDSIVTRLSDKLHSTSEMVDAYEVSNSLEDKEYSKAYESIISALSTERYNEMLSNSISSEDFVKKLRDEIIMTTLRSEANKTAILSEMFTDDSLVSKVSKDVLKTIFIGKESNIQSMEKESYAKRVFGDVLKSTNSVNEYNSEKNKELSDTIKKSTMSSIFDSILHHSDVVESTKFNTISDMYSTAFDTTNLLGGDIDLSNIEKGLNTLIGQNDLKVVETPYGRIEYRGNNKRIIRNS